MGERGEIISHYSFQHFTSKGIIHMKSENKSNPYMSMSQEGTKLKKDSSQLDIGDSSWDTSRWVYIYLFSDAAANKNGFGAYVPGVGTEQWESTSNGV